MLVTAVCPTANRLRYIPKMINCFLSQEHDFDRELIILDDGTTPCFSVVPFDSRIHYEYGQPGTWATLGEKRNAINGMASGEVIIHFDDDDWYAPDRIADQVGLLISSGKQVVGYHSMLYYREKDGGMFRYKYRGNGNYASGATQCYWKEYWAANPYSRVTVGEDSAFSMSAEQKKCLVSTDGYGKIVVRSHDSNTGKPCLGSHDFPRVNRAEFPQAFFEAEK